MESQRDDENSLHTGGTCKELSPQRAMRRHGLRAALVGTTFVGELDIGMAQTLLEGSVTSDLCLATWLAQLCQTSSRVILSMFSVLDWERLPCDYITEKPKRSKKIIGVIKISLIIGETTNFESKTQHTKTKTAPTAQGTGHHC